MVKRPVYTAWFHGEEFIVEKNIEFQWNPGFSVTQKQKSIKSLHENFEKENKGSKVLEISSKSDNKIGILASAFNLYIKNKCGKNLCTVESLFQGCKKFEKDGPFKDLINKSSREAKKDERLKNSGELICFEYKNEIWSLNPKTHFYDWLYINAIHQNKEIAKEIVKFDSFTDIEFNPKKSINNQAKAAALYVSLYKRGLINMVVNSKIYYLELMKINSNEQLKF